ncbi:hypothetical protein QZH41_006078 [Actinostola sp. cb2023]|nr:hypothetical protein QZH41_006078 [Actinostola sp. cb2023]
MEDKNNEGLGYGNKGNVYLELGDHQQALYCFEEELKIAKATNNKRNEADSYTSLGKLHADIAMLYQKNGEEEKYEQCIAKSIYFLREDVRCREWIFDHLQEEDHLKISILETFIAHYKGLAILLLQTNENEEALLVSELGRARALDDLLVSKYNMNRDIQPRREPISYAAIENMASNFSILFYSVLPQLRCTWIINQENTSLLLYKTDEAVFSEIVRSVYSTLKVREAQCEDRLIQTDEHQEEKEISVMGSSKDILLSTCESIIKQRCIPDDELYDDDYTSPLEGLYKALISPVLHKLTKDEIVIIADGPLFMVPFAALQDPDNGSFLSERKRIRLAPSLTSLKALEESPADFHSKTGALIIGNPQVGEIMFRGKKRKIFDLPCAEQEAQMIGDLHGVKPFIGPQATKEAIKQKLQKGVAIIHFAAHGTTDGEIFLTPSTTGGLPNEQDYILTMKDVQESGVRPQLVVLSCCHSGRGEVKAEGVVGMSRAFLASGARAVVASLWAIADEATMVFMEKFYKHLKGGESASKSLQQTMKDMRGIPRSFSRVSRDIGIG